MKDSDTPFGLVTIIWKYIRYYFRAVNAHSLHSPFAFRLYNEVVKSKRKDPVIRGIEKFRKTVLKNTQPLQHHDFGKDVPEIKAVTISEMGKNSGMKPRYGRLLYRLIRHMKPETMLELGTSLGLGTIYQAKAAPDARFISIEACADTISQAQRHLDAMSCCHVELLHATFENGLPRALNTLKQLDYVFIDGHHQKEPTLQYFNAILPYCSEKSVIVFDDIHWSPGMEEAWSVIRQHPQVRVTMDLFFMGFVFINPGLTRQHYAIRY